MIHLKAVLLACALTLRGALLAEGRFYNSLAELPKDDVYDFIVVGSGPGGATVASRLSEDSNVNVLLVEAGPNDEGELTIQVPGLVSSIPEKYKWNYTTTTQAGLGGWRTVAYRSGHVLGGTSSINNMVYTRGGREDYQRWVELTNDNGWTWDNLVPYFEKNENWTRPIGDRDITGQYDPSVHGYGGNLKTCLRWSPPTHSEFAQRTIRLLNSSHPEFPFILDMNGGTPLAGLGWTQWTTGGGERSSASTAYLNHEVRKRPNLSIVVNTYALRVLPTIRGKQVDFRTVELGVRYSDLPTVKHTARREVILAAGSIGTPHILLHSGIGDKRDLEAAGADPIHHLPDVGKGLADHTITYGSFSPPPIPPGLPAPWPMEQWHRDRTGPLSEGFKAHHLIWSKIPSNASIWKLHEDMSEESVPHIQVIPVDYQTGYASVTVVVLSPRSRGSVRIGSADAYASPLIDPAVLTHPYDMAALREGFRIVKRFLNHPAFDRFIFRPLSPDPEDPEFEETVRNTGTFGLWHPVGTAEMPARGAASGVVDPDLRVKGVNGLRVVDASVIPILPASHIQAPVYVLAERAADLIKAAWRR